MAEPQIDLPVLKGWRAEIGILDPGNTLYREWEIAAPEGVRFSRTVLVITETTPKGVRDMNNRIEAEAKKINMAYKCVLICLACTSGSFLEGPGYDQNIIERIEKASGSPATTTTTCVLELFKDMGIKKVVLVGPYIDSLFDAEVKFFTAYGIKALYVKGSGLGISKPAEFRAYGTDPYAGYKLVKAGAKVDPTADCIFLTCTVSPLLGVADVLEKEIGKPVISSNSATLYGMLKMLGIPDPVYHYGEALTRPRLPHQK